MAPLRIAFIGLSASAGWAKNAHSPYLLQTSKYKVTGVCNSSKESGEAAIKAYGFPSSTKAYTSPEELAEDSDAIDLVVVSVRVDKNFTATKPIAAKGIPCYVEWPLGTTLQNAEELLSLSKKAGNPRTLVGLQARRSPIVNRVKQLLAENTIGKVLHVTVRGAANISGQIDGEFQGRQLNDSKVGASILNIHFGHMVDYVLYALGEEVKDLSAIVETKRKNVQLKHSDGKLENDTRDTPDHIMLQAHLNNGAMLSIAFRGGPTFKGTPALVWNIEGEKGEIEVTAQAVVLNVGYEADATLKVHDHEKDEVRDVPFAVEDGFEKLPMLGQNVGRLYEAFADGQREGYADWEEAVGRHRLLEKMVESSEKGVVVGV